MVVTLTGGERGDILNPAMDLPEVHGRMAEIRRDEMASAAEILGVEHHGSASSTRVCPRATRRLRCPRTASGWCPLEEPAEALVRVDPQVPSARDDHLRRERRLSASGSHSHPSGVDGRLRRRRRLSAVSRGGRAMGCAQALLHPRLRAQAHAAAPGRVRQERRGGPVSRSGSSTGTPITTSSPSG